MWGRATILKLLSDYHVKYRELNVDNDTQASGSEYHQILLLQYNANLQLLNNQRLCEQLGFDYNQVFEQTQALAVVVNAVQLPIPSLEQINSLDSHHK